MSSIVPDTLKKAGNAIMGQGNKKNAQLAENMVEVNPKAPMTTDFGTKIENTDDWLRVSNNDKTGPMLLEDAIAREKVRLDLLLLTAIRH